MIAKRFLLVLSVCLGIFIPSTVAGQIHTEVEDGVSHTLAEYRASHISHVKYNLTFRIPAEDSSKVQFTAAISFEWKGNNDLLLDFAGDCAKMCRINDKTLPVTYTHEHLIIHKEYLKNGHNTVIFHGTSANKALNRNQDYLYTLFVPANAHSVFPCFDQPDLKATFSLKLHLPEMWKAISNERIIEQTTAKDNGKSEKILTFAPTPLLPTYLFSFTCGEFFQKTAVRNGRTIEALYRETDSTNVAQLNQIFDEVALSLSWLEDYTGIKFPFSKYGFVVLPGYQFGGMEHPGAIQYNEKSIFPGKNLTTDDELRRFELIAHETAHMWFGDLVTMRWFDDVWTKEVFANFLASKMSREQFPKINHDLNFLKMYQAPALSTDRTEGTHPIQQQLGNLNQAGLLYGNIIYDKAPVMMRKLEELMGPDAFRNGLRKYLSKFSFANATWDDLIDILEQEKPLAGVKDFSEVWVKQKGMPVITTHISNGQLLICQHDPYNRKLYWKQKFCVGLLKNHTVTPVTTEDIQTTEVNMTDSNTAIPIDTAYHFVIPNYDGRGYGRFVLDISNQSNITDYTNLWRYLPDLQRYALLTTLYENYLMHRCDLAAFSRLVFSSLSSDCSNELIESALCDYSSLLLLDMPVDERHHAESMLYRIAKHHCHKSIRMKALRIISTQATSPEIVDSIYHIWKDRSDTLITERDYINAAYHLAIVLPQKWQEVLTEQRSRLVNPDKQRMFDFVSRACNPSVKVQQELFQSLLDKSNRTVEPWASSMLELLSCHEREPLNNEYIMPGLNALQEIQRTGDIFFPSDWLYALLSDHTSSEAKQIVNTWLQAHQDEPLPLKNKLLQIAYRLLNRTSTY